MDELSQEQIDKLKAANAGVELHVVTAGSGEREVSVVVKVPTRDRWQRFKTQAGDPNRKLLAFESLVVDCVVHPPPPELRKMLEARPALAEAFGGSIIEIAGLEEKVVAKKL